MDWMVVGGGAALIAGLTATWGYIRAIWSQMASRVIVTMSAKDAAAHALMAYFLEDLKQSRFGPRTYQGVRSYVRPRGRYERIGMEVLGKAGVLFWDGWRPLWVSRGSDVGNDKDLTDILSRPIQVTFFRGLFEQDALVLKAIERYNQIVQDDDHNRYHVAHMAGTAGKPARISRSGDEGSDVAAEPRPVSFNREDLAGKRILGWTIDDIGPAVHSSGKAIDDLALSADASDLLQQLSRWRQHREWFQERGLPWKYGALLYGPAGTGKTAFVRAVGEDLNLPIYAFDLSTFYNDELVNSWHRMRSNTPAIALLEDLDNVFHGRERANDKIQLTFDALLNCIDGVERVDGLLLFVTTNRIEHLDSALGGELDKRGVMSRPGRIDRAVFFGQLDHAGRQHIAARILRDWPDAIAKTVNAGDGDTGAQFERRCIDIAQQRYWSDPARNGHDTDKYKPEYLIDPDTLTPDRLGDWSKL